MGAFIRQNTTRWRQIEIYAVFALKYRLVVLKRFKEASQRYSTL